MRKIVAALLFSTILLGFSFAATIGYIEVERVFNGYEETQKAQKDLNAKLKDLKKVEAKEMQRLDNAKIDGKSKDELDKIEADIKKNLDPQKAEFEMVYQERIAKIKKSIVDAVEDVAKQIGVDVVVDKQVIITGGIDLTDQVIKKLNNAK